MTDLEWRTSEVVDEFLIEIVPKVRNLERTTTLMKDNVRAMEELFKAFGAEDKFLPLVPSKTEVRIFIEPEFRKKFAEHMAHRETRIHQLNEAVHKLLDETDNGITSLKAGLGLKPISHESNEWIEYVDYVPGHSRKRHHQCNRSVAH